jgi:hypothetical protein
MGDSIMAVSIIGDSGSVFLPLYTKFRYSKVSAPPNFAFSLSLGPNGRFKDCLSIQGGLYRGGGSPLFLNLALTQDGWCCSQLTTARAELVNITFERTNETNETRETK